MFDPRELVCATEEHDGGGPSSSSSPSPPPSPLARWWPNASWFIDVLFAPLRSASLLTRRLHVCVAVRGCVWGGVGWVGAQR